MQGGGWRPDEWLALIIAGALWTPLHEPSSFDENLASLIEQIKSAVPTTMVHTDAGDAPVSAAAGLAVPGGAMGVEIAGAPLVLGRTHR